MTAIRRILLVGHTHHDVGYTNSPRLIDPAHARIVGRVLDLCDASPGDGPDAFRWTFEVARPVLRFLDTASAADVERLRARVAEGRIAITAGYLNMTQLPTETELDSAYEALDRLRAAGLPVRTEQHGDVNGIAWGTVAQMRRAGVDRLVMALNPDHGRPPFAQPTGFWWEAPDGDRVFVYLSTHYGFGEEWGIVDADVALAEERIAAFVAALEQRDDLPFDTAGVHAANDNRWPTDLFLEVVRHWNARHPDVPMRTATIDEALDALVPQAAAAPVVRGEWSDWWSHGHGSTAREVAVYREAGSLLRAARTALGLVRVLGDGEPALASVLGNRRGPVRLRPDAEADADLAAVDEQLLLFGEHTWGSWETYARPFSTFSASSWNAKAAFAYGAWDLARDLAIEGLFRVAATGATGTAEGVLLLNPTERERTAPVELEVDGHRTATVVARVPGFGTALVPVPAPPTPLGAVTTIESDRYRCTVDPERGGVVSLVHLPTGRELVDADVPHGLGAVVVEQVAAGSTHPMLRDPKAFHPEDPGPDFTRVPAAGTEAPEAERGDGFVRIVWRTTAPGIPAISTALTLYDGLDLVDVAVSIRKPEVFGPESVHVAFPFAVTEPRFLLETAGAVYEADAEQLPDTSKDWYSIQHAVGVAGADGGVLWSSPDVPLVQLGGFHTGEWARTLRVEGGAVNSWLMNNLHFTNFQARQDGTGTYRYRVLPTAAAPDAAAVRRFGRDAREPLVARQYAGPLREGPTGLVVRPAETVLAEVRPAPDGARVRLRNPTPEAVPAVVELAGTVRWSGTLPPYGVADAHLSR